MGTSVTSAAAAGVLLTSAMPATGQTTAALMQKAGVEAAPKLPAGGSEGCKRQGEKGGGGTYVAVRFAAYAGTGI